MIAEDFADIKRRADNIRMGIPVQTRAEPAPCKYCGGRLWYLPEIFAPPRKCELCHPTPEAKP